MLIAMNVSFPTTPEGLKLIAMNVSFPTTPWGLKLKAMNVSFPTTLHWVWVARGLWLGFVVVGEHKVLLIGNP